MNRSYWIVPRMQLGAFPAARAVEILFWRDAGAYTALTRMPSTLGGSRSHASTTAASSSSDGAALTLPNCTASSNSPQSCSSVSTRMLPGVTLMSHALHEINKTHIETYFTVSEK